MEPAPAELAVLMPRCEVAPVALARYLLSSVPFALLMPVDLLAMAAAPNVFPRSPHNEIAARFTKTGKVTILATQMTWVLGNMEDCHPVEIFSNTLRTPAPVTRFGYLAQSDEAGNTRAILPDHELDEVEGTVPRTLEAWVRAQKLDLEFDEVLKFVGDRALRWELWIQATPGQAPTIIAPKTCQELLVWDTHARMHHLGSVKVFDVFKRSYFWLQMKKDTRKILANCPECEVNKARQNTAHALFHATPIHAHRARWCMNFQGRELLPLGRPRFSPS
jgi:hypothetical protein